MVRTDAPAPPREGGMVRSVRTLAAGVISGWAVGLVAGGLGSRVAMRVMAMTTPEAHGRLTEAGATVGEITAGGTIFLLMSGAILGGWGGAVYVGARGALPGRGWRQGLVFGLLLMVASGAILVSADNPDFRILRPAGLAVAMFLALPVLFGLLLAPLVGRVETRLRAFRRPFVLAVPVALGLLPLALVGPTGTVLLVAGVAVLLLHEALGARDRWAARLAAVVLVAALLVWRAWALVDSVVEIV